MPVSIRSFVAGAAIASIVAFTIWTSAAAHAIPERASPPIDGVAAAAPGVLEIWFTEEVDPTVITVTVLGPDGTRVDRGDAAVDLFDPQRRRVTATLTPGLGPGVYIVQWHSASAIDTDAVDGSFRFTIDPAATPVPVTLTATAVTAPATAVMVTSSPAPTPAAGEDEAYDFDARAFGLSVAAGVLAAIGILLFWRLVRPRPAG